MPSNELKTRTRFSTTLDKDVEKRLKEYSKKTMIPVSKIVDAAIKDYIDKQVSKFD